MKALVVLGLGLAVVACRGIVANDEPTDPGDNAGAPSVGGAGGSDASVSGGSGGSNAGGTGGASAGGMGGTAGVDADTDAGCVSSFECAAMAGPCVTGACVDGECEPQYLPAGAACVSVGTTSVCDGSGACVAIGCTNAVKDGDESDVDCGGSCPACGNGLSCSSVADCASGFCDPIAGECAPCASNDDCQIPATPVCDMGVCSSQKPLGVACSNAGDCLSGYCVDGVCCVQESCGPSGCLVCSKPGLEGTCHEAPSGTACVGGKCDGAGVCTSGGCLWTKSPATYGDGHAYSIAVDAAGNAVVTGEFEGTLDFGCGPVTSAALPGQSGTSDVFVAMLDPAGSCLWSKASGDTKTQVGVAVAVDPLGSPLVVGRFWSTIDFGCGPMTSAALSDAFVAKLSASGACTWSKSTGAPGTAATGVTSDSAGNVLVTGSFNQSFDFGCSAPLANPTGGLFVAKLDPSGSCTWLKGASYASSWAIATDAADNVLVAGYFTTSNADLGCGTLTKTGDWDGLVAKLDSSGKCLWSKALASDKQDSVTDVAVDQQGNVYVAGYSSGSLDAGCGPMAAGGGSDVFIAKLDGQGTCVWSKLAGNYSAQRAFGIALDGSANVIVVGDAWGTLDLGCGPMTSPSTTPAFVSKLDAMGTCLWSKLAGGSGIAFGVASDPSGNVALSGEFNGSLDLGCAPVPIKAGTRPFVAKLSP